MKRQISSRLKLRTAYGQNTTHYGSQTSVFGEKEKDCGKHVNNYMVFLGLNFYEENIQDIGYSYSFQTRIKTDLVILDTIRTGGKNIFFSTSKSYIVSTSRFDSPLCFSWMQAKM